MKGSLPKRLSSRIALVLFAGLAITEFASFYIREMGGRTALTILEGYELVERISAITQLIERTPPSERDATLRSIDRASLHVAWQSGSAVSTDVEREPTLDLIREIVALQTEEFGPDRFRVAYGRGPTAAEVPSSLPEARVRGGNGSGVRSGLLDIMHDVAMGRHFLISVRLSDGSWLNFSAPYIRSLSLLTPQMMVSLALTAVVVFALTLWAVRSVVRPLDSFSVAAERLSKDIYAPTLAERGPIEVRRAVTAFNTMQTRVRRFIEDRTQMLAAVSHDLRTPITRMRLRAEAILDPESRAGMIANLDEMEAMVSASLNLARQEIEVEPRRLVDLGRMVREIKDDQEAMGIRVGISGVPSLPYLCRPLALRRALVNLVENAANYGVDPRVALNEADGLITIEIEDSGPGIPESQREKVFRPFYRLDQGRHRHVGGAGIGLSVARTIARAHGGDVTLHDARTGAGLLVKLQLPASANTSPTAAVADRPSPSTI